jgi:hypothetical protein
MRSFVVGAALVVAACSPAAAPPPEPPMTAASASVASAPTPTPAPPPPPPLAARGSTDPYALALQRFFRERLKLPSSLGATRDLCTVWQVAVTKDMVLWHVWGQPVRASGADAFDGAVRDMLADLVESRTPLPTPPPDLDDSYRRRTVRIAVTGDAEGDVSRCK